MDKHSEVWQIIDKFKRDVLREKYFLQEEGGRRYKLVNGTLIGHKNDYSTYSFEMEAELNLPDDAPITLTVGDVDTFDEIDAEDYDDFDDDEFDEDEDWEDDF